MFWEIVLFWVILTSLVHIVDLVPYHDISYKLIVRYCRVKAAIPLGKKEPIKEE